ERGDVRRRGGCGVAAWGGAGAVAAPAAPASAGTVMTGIVRAPRARAARDTGHSWWCWPAPRRCWRWLAGVGGAVSRTPVTGVTPVPGQTFVPSVHRRHKGFARTTT